MIDEEAVKKTCCTVYQKINPKTRDDSPHIGGKRKKHKTEKHKKIQDCDQKKQQANCVLEPSEDKQRQLISQLELRVLELERQLRREAEREKEREKEHEKEREQRREQERAQKATYETLKKDLMLRAETETSDLELTLKEVLATSQRDREFSENLRNEVERIYQL